MYEMVIFFTIYIIALIELELNVKEVPMDTPYTVIWTERCETGDIEYSKDFDVSLTDAILFYQQVIKDIRVHKAQIVWGSSTLNTYKEVD